MGQVIFGQPDNGIIQMSYVVQDIHEAMRAWSASVGVGPWFLLEHFTGVDPVYRGQPSQADVAIAMGFAGHMNIELIQPNNDAPSVYKEHIDRHGYGFHHFGIASRHFEKDLAEYQARGLDLVFIAGVPSGGKVAYMDTTATMPGYVELIEIGDGFDDVFGRFHRESQNWDGRDPVRSFI
jgi:hypothetical protein